MFGVNQIVSSSTKLGLGTVQFGIKYGVFNGSPNPDEAMVKEILEYGVNAGVKILDTAPSYGVSEEVIGKTLAPASPFKIITKTMSFSGEATTAANIKAVEVGFNSSLKKLKQENIEAILVHQAKDLFKPGGDRIVNFLLRLRNEGRVNKIGVSVYDAKEIDRVLDIFDPDIIQLPINVFDQRLVESGHLDKLKNSGVHIHARSLFLQGIALMPNILIPSYFSSVMNKFVLFEKLALSCNLSKLELCLLFVNQIKSIDVMLVGVRSIQDLKEIIQAETKIKDCNIDFSQIAINDCNYVNPSNWTT
ncbi:MAG: aldo/keto reductase [Halopseudomonas aestusnigri]